MGFSIKKVANVATGGGLGAAQALAKGDLKGAAISAGTAGLMDKDQFDAATGKLKGADAKIAGKLGMGEVKSKGAGINEAAFGNQTDARKAEFASQLAASQGRAAPTMTAAQVGPAAMGTAAVINQNPQAEFRGQQAGLAQALQAQAMGQGPSLAQSQLRQATDRNIAQSMAMAASQRGATAGQGLRQIAQQAAGANQQAAQQSADLRMQEQMAARQQLGGVLNAGREQDIGLATSQAGLEQQTGLANQGATNTFALKQADLTQGASVANQGAALTQTGLNDAQSRFFNGGMADMEQKDREAAMALEKLKVDQNTSIEGLNAGNKQAANAAKANMVGGIAQGLAMFSDKELKEDVTDGSTRTDKFLKGFSSALKSDGGKPNPYQGQHDTGNAIGQGLGKLGKMGKKLFDKSAPLEIDEEPSFTGDVTGGSGVSMMAAHGGKVPGKAAYPGDDERNDTVHAKVSPGEVIVPRSAASDDDKLEAFVKALSNSEYKYKDQKNGKGVHVSPMAQELEKSELGRSMVTDTEEGKVVNYAKAGGLLLSTAAMLNDKIGDLDKRLAMALEKKRSA